MRDAKKYVTKQMGFSTSSIPGSVLPPDVTEGTCPLCGHFQPLQESGYCGTEKCRSDAKQKAREIARNAGGNVPGLYYRFGDLEVINFTKLEQWEEPKQVKHPDMCQTGECTNWALVADHLCKHHRLVENREEYWASDRVKRKVRKSGRSKGKSKKLHGNKIRGLGKIKL